MELCTLTKLILKCDKLFFRNYLIEENALLKEELNRLKSSQKLNSENSSKPHSTDRKSNNSREKKGRKAGGTSTNAQ